MKLYKNFIFTLLINLFIASTHAESGVDIMHGLHEARTGMFITDFKNSEIDTKTREIKEIVERKPENRSATPNEKEQIAEALIAGRFIHGDKMLSDSSLISRSSIMNRDSTFDPNNMVHRHFAIIYALEDLAARVWYEAFDDYIKIENEDFVIDDFVDNLFTANEFAQHLKILSDFGGMDADFLKPLFKSVYTKHCPKILPAGCTSGYDYIFRAYCDRDKESRPVDDTPSTLYANSTAQPTQNPTEVPTTEVPTKSLTLAPTHVPTGVPSAQPTPVPSQSSTLAPTKVVCDSDYDSDFDYGSDGDCPRPEDDAPSTLYANSTAQPTHVPTGVPSAQPTPVPSQSSTLAPTKVVCDSDSDYGSDGDCPRPEDDQPYTKS